MEDMAMNNIPSQAGLESAMGEVLQLTLQQRMRPVTPQHVQRPQRKRRWSILKIRISMYLPHLDENSQRTPSKMTSGLTSCGLHSRFLYQKIQEEQWMQEVEDWLQYFPQAKPSAKGGNVYIAFLMGLSMPLYCIHQKAQSMV